MEVGGSQLLCCLCLVALLLYGASRVSPASKAVGSSTAFWSEEDLLLLEPQVGAGSGAAQHWSLEFEDFKAREVGTGCQLAIVHCLTTVGRQPEAVR